MPVFTHYFLAGERSDLIPKMSILPYHSGRMFRISKKIIDLKEAGPGAWVAGLKKYSGVQNIKESNLSLRSTTGCFIKIKYLVTDYCLMILVMPVSLPFTTRIR
jgi:hypothetical protein